MRAVVKTGRFDWSTATGPALDRLLLDLIQARLIIVIASYRFARMPN